jgi:DNA (cytosine-5)-methyltransferase 1
MLKVISLFSGCGGLDLGFMKCGFDIVFANDIDTIACKTYSNNIKHNILCEDIYKINTSDIPQADIIIGGFPCLGFTIAKGKSRTIEDSHNKLYKEYLRIVKDKAPKLFLIENVVGIQSGVEFKNFFESMLNDFKQCNNGYNVDYKILTASDYGVPQNRKRVIIIGIKSDSNLSIQFPNPLTTPILTIRDAIKDLPYDFTDTFPNHQGTMHKIKLNNYIGNRILSWDKPSPTITGRGSRSGGAVIHPHPEKHRRLSVRECARIQSFPDDFIFYGSNGANYAHIGNAVPPLLSFTLANNIRSIFNLEQITLNKSLFNLPYITNFAINQSISNSKEVGDKQNDLFN